MTDTGQLKGSSESGINMRVGEKLSVKIMTKKEECQKRGIWREVNNEQEMLKAWNSDIR